MDHKLWRGFDYSLFGITIILCLVGLILLYSAAHQKAQATGINFVARQAVWMSIALLALIASVIIDYRKIEEASWLLYGITLILLLLVLWLGQVRLGAQRWLRFGAFTFQPSELMKVALILVLARYLGQRQSSPYKLKPLMVAIALVLVPSLLVLKQPDLGTAVLFLPILFCMLWVWGARLKHLLYIFGLGIISSPILWHLLRGYQKERLQVFLNPNIDPLGAGYTIIQSKIAIGSGGWFGKGWLAGTQNQLNFLPEHHTDFIFSVVGEEWGFVGGLVLILLYFLIIRRGLRVIGETSDITGKLLATGLVVMLSIQVVINIGMTIGIMPVTGLTLPLVSYGGSSFLITMISIGILLNIRMRRTVF